MLTTATILFYVIIKREGNIVCSLFVQYNFQNKLPNLTDLLNYSPPLLRKEGDSLIVIKITYAERISLSITKHVDKTKSTATAVDVHLQSKAKTRVTYKRLKKKTTERKELIKVEDTSHQCDCRKIM